MNWRDNFRTKPWRCPKYVKWLKEQDCVCGCGMPADDPHHLIDVELGGAMGTKQSDILAIPMTRGCHNKLHHNVKVWEQMHGLQLVHLARTIDKAVRQGVVG